MNPITEKKKNNYKVAFVLALLLHVTLGVLLFATSGAQSYGQKIKQKKTVAMTGVSQSKDKSLEIIKAHAVNPALVAAQVKAIQSRRKAELSRQQKQLAKARAAVKASNAVRKRARIALASLKKQQIKATKKLNQSRKLQQQLEQKRVQTQTALKAQQVLLTQSTLHKEQERALAQKRARQQQRAKEQKIRGILNQYKSRILAVIASHWVVPANIQKGLACQLLIRLSPAGKVLKVDLVRSSGNALLDRSARLAVFKASPLPVPKDPEILPEFSELRLTVRPEDITG